MKLYSILSISLCIIFGVSCFTKEQKKETVSQDLAGLKKLINLDSINPNEVKWLHQAIGNEGGLGPTDFQLTIILALNKEEWNNIKIKSEKIKNWNKSQDMFFDKDFVKNWFPQAIKKSFSLEENKYKSSAYICSPKLFTKSPFLNGYCFFTEENYVFIFLYTT